MLDGLFKKKTTTAAAADTGGKAASDVAATPTTDAGKDHAADGQFRRDTRKARRFFEHAQAVADHDYAIECFVNGLRLDPDNLAMHDALREVALRRKAAGGKPAGVVEKFKGGGKTVIDKFMHAEMLWAKDPLNVERMVAVLELAGEADETIDDVNMAAFIKWMGRLVIDAGGKRPSKQVYVRVRDVLAAAQDFEQAAEVCRLAIQQDPDDPNLIHDLKNLEAERTIKAAQYSREGGGDFKASVKDMAMQQALDQQDRLGSQSADATDKEIARRRAEFEEDPQDVVRMGKLVDALRKKATPAAEEEAMRLLREAWEQTGQYRFKQMAGDIHMKQLARQDTVLNQAS